jgi:hypothetical protein
MNRRHLLKNVLAGSASLFVLPSWTNLWNSSSIVADLFSPAEKKVMTALVETIIPDSKDIPGAKALGVDVFIEKLLKDCYETEIQQSVVLNLATLERNARAVYGNSFDACSADQRESIFGKFEKFTEKTEADFFKLIKMETIRGYTTSEYVMVNHFGYKVAPGHYHGCVSVNT